MASPLSPFRWERDAVVEQYRDRCFRYGHWDERFGFWASDGRHPGLTHFYPPWTLFDASGRVAPGFCFSHYLTITPGWAAPHVASSAESIFRRYGDLVPEAVRRVAGAFGPWQWVVLAMMWDRSAFVDFLTIELARSGPGFVAASLVMNGADQLAPGPRTELCERIMSAKRAEVIPGIPADCSPKRVVAALGKLPMGSLTEQTLKALIGVVSDEAKAKIVSHCPKMTHQSVQLLDRLPVWMCEAMSPRLLGELSRCAHRIQRVRELARQVDRDAPAMREAVRDSLHKAKDVDHFLEVADEWALEIRETTGYPAPPFPGSGPLRPLSSAKTLRAEGRRMRNCIAGYVSDVLAGQVYFYRWDAKEPATVMLRRDLNAGWRLTESLGESNTVLSDSTKVRIRDAVRAMMAPDAAVPIRVRPAAPPIIPVWLPRKPIGRGRKTPLVDPRQFELVF